MLTKNFVKSHKTKGENTAIKKMNYKMDYRFVPVVTTHFYSVEK
jgi:hypothetical protein